MRRDLIDFFLIQDGQLGIHERLENWARWVKPRPHGWHMQPMFRQFRSKAWQWEMPGIKLATDELKAADMEKAVSALPEKHRAAIRWCYVFKGSPGTMARDLAVTKQGLMDLIDAGRFMLINRGL